MKLVILGAGGYGRTVADVAEQSGKYDEVLFLDDNSGMAVGKCADYVNYKNCEVYPAFGNNEMRLEWISRLESEDFLIPTIIHETAYVSPKAKVNKGTVILPKAVINTEVIVEKGCIINCGAIIDHGCVIEAGVHLCPGVVVKAENRIKSGTKIESGEVIQARIFPV